MSEPVLRVERLVKDYGGFRALDNVSFEIKKGQVLGLLGPNGAGKSTTLQILIGLTIPTAGKIHYFGQDFFKDPQSCLQKLNFASAYNTLQWRISVKENLLVFAGLYKLDRPEEKIMELLDYFEIRHLANMRYRWLSAGEKTRVNLIKALLNDPELVLMDEPTASLDPDIADKTLSLIENLRSQRDLSLLFTSHNMPEVERICDEVIFLDHGKIVSRDTPANHTKRFSEVDLLIEFKGDRQALEELINQRGLAFTFPATHRLAVKLKKSESGPLIADIERKGFKITDLEIRRPDLEDVFLQIARSK